MPDYAQRELFDDFERESEEQSSELSQWQSPAQAFQAKLKARLRDGFTFQNPIQQKLNNSLPFTLQKQETPQEEVLQAKTQPETTTSGTGNSPTLPGDLKNKAESVLQEDLSGVEIKESQSAADIGALAYTQGSEITFAPGQFQPNTSSGQALIGHELTHVKQQRQSRVQPTTQTQGLPVNDDSGLEREADETGQRIAQSPGGSSIQRETRSETSAPSLQLKSEKSLPTCLEERSISGATPTEIPRAGVIQGSFISDILSAVDSIPGVDMDEIIDSIPGYQLFCQVIAYDVLRDRNVQRDGRVLLRELMSLPPGGELLYTKLNEYGIIDGAFEWVEGELSRLNLTQDRFTDAIRTAWDQSSSPIPYDFGDKLIREFSPILSDVRTFAGDALDALIDLLTEALARPLVDYLDENSPAYRLATKVLHRRFPLEDPVEASTEDIIRDFLILIGKQTELEQMEERGTLTEMAAWIDTQLGRFDDLTSRFIDIVNRVWDAFSIENLSDILGVFEGILNDFADLLQDFFEFAAEVAAKVLELVKDSLLGMLSEQAAQTPGYPLIRVLLGKDPFTEEPVERNATNIIHGFLSLLPGGEETFQRLQESGAIQRMTSWIEGAVERLGISWDYIIGLFTDIWNSLSIEDLVNPIGAFIRIIETFGEPIGRLMEFIFEVIQALLQFVLEAMNFPTRLITNIINKAMQAYEDIKRDPMGFFMNLLRAVKLGFQQFFDNIGTHLLNGLVDWLFGQMAEAGITPPTDLSFQSILNLVLEILGISVEQIMQKIGERIGPERMEQIQGFIDQAVGIFNLVSDVMERGPIALWEHIQAQLSNLWDMVLENVRNWIMEQIITRVAARLLTMLDPTGIGALINGAMAFFNAVQSFIQYLTEMLEIINSFVEGVANIAQGNLNQAANFLENALADGIPVAIGFLANQVGLGGLGRRIGEMIQALQERVDRAIDSVLDWIAGQMRNLMRAMGLGGAEGAETEADQQAESNPDVRTGLEALRQMDSSYADAPSRENAERVASTVREQHSVFQEIRVIEDENSFDYQYRTAEAPQFVRVETATRVGVVQRMAKEDNSNQSNEELESQIKAILDPYLEEYNQLDDSNSIQVTTNNTQTSRAQRARIQELGSQLGACSTCPGDQTQTWIVDHIPPRELVAAGLMSGPIKLYPQSVEMQTRQGALVREILAAHEAGETERVNELLNHELLKGNGPSIPCSNPNSTRGYTPTEQSQIQALGNEHGCHQGGGQVASSTYFADHVPPKELVGFMEEFYERTIRQRLRPQCTLCSNTQGGVITDQAAIVRGLMEQLRNIRED